MIKNIDVLVKYHSIIQDSDITSYVMYFMSYSAILSHLFCGVGGGDFWVWLGVVMGWLSGCCGVFLGEEVGV